MSDQTIVRSVFKFNRKTVKDIDIDGKRVLLKG